jgi:hypothetical protein
VKGENTMKIEDPENKALFQCVQDLERHVRRLNSGVCNLSPEDIRSLFTPLWDQMEVLQDETQDQCVRRGGAAPARGGEGE